MYKKYLDKTKGEKLKESLNLHDNYDCYELAEDIVRTIENGKIINIENENKSEKIKVIEYGEIKDYEYHCAALNTDINKILDKRMSDTWINQEKYIKIIQDLNQGKKIKFVFN